MITKTNNLKDYISRCINMVAHSKAVKKIAKSEQYKILYKNFFQKIWIYAKHISI